MLLPNFIKIHPKGPVINVETADRNAERGPSSFGIGGEKEIINKSIIVIMLITFGDGCRKILFFF